MPIRFIFFDLGKVLLHFDRDVGFQKVAAVAGCGVEDVRSAILDSGLLWRFEAGEIGSDEFHTEFCRATGTKCDAAEFALAHSEIFELNTSIVPVVAGLAAAGYRLGLLSNICVNHWEYCSSGRYTLIARGFEQFVLSFRVGAIKSKPAMYSAAIDAAGVDAGEIFYTDDIEENVDAARSLGIDAVQYTSTPSLVASLRSRGILFNF